ncbi:cytoplasmic protein [Mycena floridula]|nr:cytoplasmic protein [Mycena floridula]
MVLFFTSTATGAPVTLYMGRDKVENEELIRYAWPQDIWFHVDKLSSAHVYLAIPEKLLEDCAQLVKANSIEGNKNDNLTIIYTPADNLKVCPSFLVGVVKRIHTPTRSNPIVDRLNKTKSERTKKADLELARQREAEKAARSYDSLFTGEDDLDEDAGPKKTGRELEEDFM